MGNKERWVRGDIDVAAQFVQKLQGDAIWDRTPEKIRDRYRNKVRIILELCGVKEAQVTGRYDHTEPEQVNEDEVDAAEDRYARHVEPK